MNNSKPTTTDAKKEFHEIRRLIETAKSQALKSVNKELITLYWNVGERISRRLNDSQWGDAVVEQLATYLRRTQPELKGFSRRGLYRMRQFYETYNQLENVSTLLTQIPWSCHLHIMAKTKTIEEKVFYLRLAAKEKYAVRELGRQIDSCLYERIMLSKITLPKNVKEYHENSSVCILLCKSKDSEVVEFALSRNVSPTLVAE
ncbi:MAG: DUF1016 domain-containing protein, partial [bacterium]|nr:DUF1016 domain-containing protein [bacterium]